MLNIRDAMKLHHILKDFVPTDVKEDTKVIDFVDIIMKNIKDAGAQESFADALVLMSGESLESLDEMEGKKVLDLFVDGLIENNIFQLRKFCEGLAK